MPFHAGVPVTVQIPFAPRVSGTVVTGSVTCPEEYTCTDTACAVGAQSASFGTPLVQVSPRVEVAAPASMSSSTPGTCRPVASSSFPAASKEATATCPVSRVPARAASVGESFSAGSPACAGNLARTAAGRPAGSGMRG